MSFTRDMGQSSVLAQAVNLLNGFHLEDFYRALPIICFDELRVFSVGASYPRSQKSFDWQDAVGVAPEPAKGPKSL